MAVVEGQIETLKELKSALSSSGITRFNSVGEIRSFLRDYESEQEELPNRIERELTTEIQRLRSGLESHQQACEGLSKNARSAQEQEIVEINAELQRASAKRKENSLFRFLYSLKISFLSRRAARLERNLEKVVNRKTRRAAKKVAALKTDLENLLENRESLALQRYKASLQDLIHTKEVVDGLYPLVAGAIGEASVVSALRELSDEYYVINDFSMKFDPPIYNKKDGDRIYSVQIDHLLISKAGIFLLETKNWSKASVQSLDLRSPVEQIKRTSFALFVMLNSDSGARNLGLARHHWGAKKIPIRNIIVMTNDKPREQFKYVKVLSVPELIGYIKYFDQTFDGEEVKDIFEYLKSKT